MHYKIDPTLLTDEDWSQYVKEIIWNLKTLRKVIFGENQNT